MQQPKILAFAGSARKDSYNKLLIKIVANGSKNAGANVSLIDLRDYPMPIYDADLEASSGLPENAIKLKKLFLEHHGLLLACPEYNSSITPLLKNTLDWVSRPSQEEKSLACYENKVAALLSASPGALGGLRGLVHVRSILSNIKVLVIPEQIAVPKAPDAFDVDGTLRDKKLQQAVENLGASLTKILYKLSS